MVRAGGRILKDETLAAAFQRISAAELGRSLQQEQSRFRGVFEHLYRENFACDPGFGTHYVVLAYELTLEPGVELPDGQHSEYRWLAPGELLRDDRVHPNTQAYFR